MMLVTVGNLGPLYIHNLLISTYDAEQEIKMLVCMYLMLLFTNKLIVINYKV